MRILMVPGLWLNGASWDRTLPPIAAAGHDPSPVTLPGMESRDADRSDLGLRDHVDHVIALVDAAPEDQVVLVGHSGGGAVIHAVVDARPDRIARAVYVDSVPTGPGGSINDSLPVVDGEVPLPDWSVFDDEDLVDLDGSLRERMRAESVPSPVRVCTDAQELHDERRYEVPVTVITCEYPRRMLEDLMDEDHESHGYVRELSRVADVEIVELTTGHWPQYTRPVELGELIAAVVDRRV